MLYAFELPAQIVVLPEIFPGTAGWELTVTFNVWAVDVPQVLIALTVTAPLLLNAVALIVFEVELPFHPEGKVQA